MKMTLNLIIFLLLLTSNALIYGQKPAGDLKRTVILISIDGFRADYFEKYSPPTLNGIATNGVRANHFR